MTSSDFEQKRERRKERLLARAERAEREGQAAYAAADRIAKGIPPGQPILVGHHSERRHRAALERIDRGMAKSSEKRKEADDLRRKAEVVGTAGISSDDPEACTKLLQKLDGLERRREHWKALNEAWRKAGKPTPVSSKGWEPIAATLGVPVAGLNELRLEMATRGTSQPKTPPFPAYAFTNLGAEIRRLKTRIEELKEASTGEASEVDHGICRVVEDPAENRIRLLFPGKPVESVRVTLKQFGFRWSPRAMAWQRHLNGSGRAAARFVIEALSKGVSDGTA